MVSYLGWKGLRQLVQTVGVGPMIERLATEIEVEYRRWPAFEHSARVAHHTAEGAIELMPSTDGRLYSLKVVNGHPGNPRHGLLTVAAFGVLMDAGTGYPLLVSELTFTTALRTAAMSALAARWMARADSRVLALIGNGAQSEFQALAFHRVLGIRELRLFDVDPAATDKLVRNLSAQEHLRPLTLIRCVSPADAARGADIVTTATADKRRAHVLGPEMIEPGMHLNAVGGDCPGKTELHPDILRRPDLRIVVEYEPQTRVEGEIQHLPADHPVTAFADVVAHRAPGRAHRDEVTLFDSVGFALEDHAALRVLHALAQEHPRCVEAIDLVPEPGDPKDLFGQMLRPEEPSSLFPLPWAA